MRTMIITAVATMGLASGVAYADGGEGPAADTLFTQIPGVVAMPAGNVPSVDTARQAGPIDNRSSRSRWLAPPIFTVPGMARH